MTIKPVRPQKGSDLVLHHLAEQIRSGHYPLGSKLPTVVDLAAGFEVGRSTVREALSGLKAMGLVDIRHGGGTYVCETLPAETAGQEGMDFFRPIESLKEVLEVRKYIESGCAELAALRRSEADLAAIEAVLVRMRETLGDEKLAEKADVDFHVKIAEASHNTLLLQMMLSLTQRLQENMSDSRRLWFFAERSSVELLLAEHTGIYEAIRDRNTALAGERMSAHIGKVDRIVRQLSREDKQE
ncbi:GntR family transcriptional regulator, transcriptional repressor for pyruvate dehydrogenase complex [Paenibacillus sp. UNCCL117]|uniref:FadR/GntR family transcriptional regulator n=1 Tax=unclassified Paenibacillus TaxID=185978 RepID=UPI0008901A31|nr:MULTISPECIES: FadR/GntR family transcriptional regulator [unclassified Paenibacillus]SDE29567.1 transcriptional regulator, GntR family [Paenibacillus sp. cl123]SFW63246.1 GntR family transcriptional regulator, transcriptional repressor for pyruvate dehydrogenase complex [Paenibacillus sp. UNCCL117]